MQEGSRELGEGPDLTGYDSEDDGEDVSTDGPIVLPSHQVNEKALELERQHTGQLFFTDKVLKLMKDMFDEVYVALQPKQEDWEARRLVIQFIEKFVKYKISGCSISAFGSFVMNLYTASSDLDLSLNLSDGKRERSRNDKVHYLRKVANALYGLQNGSRTVRGIETVYRAAVPVVKFVELKTGIECDISVENNDGVLKSQVLGMFATIDTRFRQLCYLVKAWAKKHNVNSSKNGTLNSLSICLLVAFHLQTCSPPILPPFSVFMEGLYLPAVENCLNVVAARVRSFKESGYGSDNHESVPELFGSFFVKLVAVENLWGHGLCSSTYEGKWISKIWPKNHIGCISVEDFADRTQNVARSVSRKEFELIYQCLHATLSNLKDPVNNVADSKDLRVYLFGLTRQKHRSLDRSRIATTHADTWQSANGWSTSEVRSHVSSNRGRQIHADSSIQVQHNRMDVHVPAHTVIGTSGYGYSAQAGPVHKHGKSRSGYAGNHGRAVNSTSTQGAEQESEHEVLGTHIDVEYPKPQYTRNHGRVVNPARAHAADRKSEHEALVPHIDVEYAQPQFARNHGRVVNSTRAAGRESEHEALVTHIDVEYPQSTIILDKRSFPFRVTEQPTAELEFPSAGSRNRHVYRNGAQVNRTVRAADPYDGRVGHLDQTHVIQGGYGVVGNRPGTCQRVTNPQGVSPSHPKHRRRGNRTRTIPTTGVVGDVQPHNMSNYQPDGGGDGRWLSQGNPQSHEVLFK